MSDWKIRRTARDANRQLDLGAHPSLNSIKSSLEAARGRPITIMELPTLRGDDLCGLCVAYSSHDVVVHAPPRSRLHQQQIIVHEFAHMILNHQITATSLQLVQLPGFNETPLQVLGRNSFDDDDEAAAEFFADLLMARIRPDLEGPTDDQPGFNKVFG